MMGLVIAYNVTPSQVEIMLSAVRQRFVSIAEGRHYFVTATQTY